MWALPERGWSWMRRWELMEPVVGYLKHITKRAGVCWVLLCSLFVFSLLEAAPKAAAGPGEQRPPRQTVGFARRTLRSGSDPQEVLLVKALLDCEGPAVVSGCLACQVVKKSVACLCYQTYFSVVEPKTEGKSVGGF